MEANEGLQKLREKVPAHLVNKLPKPTKAQTDAVKADYKVGVRCEICGGWHHPKVVHLDYFGHAALTDLLLTVDSSWNWEPLAVGADGLPAIDKDGGLWIRLTVCGVTRLGYGDAQGKSGGDAMKERIGDALRNAAMRFGAALELWVKGDLHADEVDPPAPKKQSPAADFKAEEKTLLDCASMPSLAIAWGKLDKPTQHALSALKEKCKLAIMQADKDAQLEDINQ